MRRMRLAGVDQVRLDALEDAAHAKSSSVPAESYPNGAGGGRYAARREAVTVPPANQYRSRASPALAIPMQGS